MKKIALFALCISIVVSFFAFAAAARTGQQLYESTCKVCHETGISGAPKFGDKKWVELDKKEGVRELTKDAIKGVRAMPPKGGCTDCTDAEIKAAVEYMIKSAKKK